MLKLLFGFWAYSKGTPSSFLELEGKGKKNKGKTLETNFL